MLTDVASSDTHIATVVSVSVVLCVHTFDMWCVYAVISVAFMSYHFTIFVNACPCNVVVGIIILIRIRMTVG